MSSQENIFAPEQFETNRWRKKMISFVVGNAKPAIQNGEINVGSVVNTCPNDELFLHPSFSFFEPAKLALSIVEGL
ncbi:MAG: hypothetical protein COS98_02090 [Parcubacteria group bacterium CG07_land_8_20_14_0_80_35_11]|nr:MAG: hypothetical protein COS98_02090 [Parcubacteria group bacterium CG07_land_8_20_14_0_80_35_11]